MKLFKKILIANRGEIAVRVMKTAKTLGIKTVAIYSEVDSESLHVAMADEVYCIGKSELSETYLNIPKIIETAKMTGAEAIHPGYGFLAENPKFMKACKDAGIIFIGPDEKPIYIMGNKIESRDFVRKLNIPLTEGITGTPQQLLKAGDKIPFPLLIKAAAGGGGKGMRIVWDKNELKDSLEATSREAKNYFSDPTVYIEKYIEEPRHIEIQVLGDNHGNAVYLFERECSIQRRYQKIIEEAPSVTLTPEIRKNMGECAVKIAKAIGYNSAGTVEFLVDKNLNFYFLEMNTRIQVEHPVTELTTGLDIVEEQIYIAAGYPLRFNQKALVQSGHAIECRIYAEDPANQFLPSPGKMLLYKEPEITTVRLDTGITENTEIKSFFDPMICKIISWGEDREEARLIMINAIKEYAIHGIKTNISYLIKALENEAYINNNLSTKFCDLYTETLNKLIEEEKANTPAWQPILIYLLYSLNTFPAASRFETHDVWDIIGYWRNIMFLKIKYRDKEYNVELKQQKGGNKFIFDNTEYVATIEELDRNKIVCTINNIYFTAYISEDEQYKAYLTINGLNYELKRLDLLSNVYFKSEQSLSGEAGNFVTAPMPGKVIKVNVKEGDKVAKGALLLIIEAMKMENRVTSPRDAVVEKLSVCVGEMVDGLKPLVVFRDDKV
ncbi:MAG: biotin/lipoyl-binding protein [Bacteroidia bacterium]|nr:biotin/lipoyl-binding protein [Bacteroidia bacterium]